MNTSIYQLPQTQRLIEYLRDQYGERTEFLWENLAASIWRATSNGKWYAVLARVPHRKITGSSDDLTEILDLRYQRDLMPDWRAHEARVYPGWHMNKDNWYTLILDDSFPDTQLWELVDNSRQIAARKK